MQRLWRLGLLLLGAAALACPAHAQQSPPPASAAPAKPAPKPVPRPPTAKPAAPAAAVAGGAQPKLLGQYGTWGAYTASQAGKKVCFAIAKPMSAETNPPNRPRNPAYMFISTRPADKVTNEVSIVIGYPFKPGSDAGAQIGSTSFALYTQLDGAWIKNGAEEAHMIDLMRTADTAVVKGVSVKGTQSTDTYTLKGIAQALERTAQECK
ncbi:MAG: Invasion associated locus B family protein [Xanthobacteraceae bacterium]